MSHALKFLVLSLLAMLTMAGTPSIAQTYPNKPIKIMVGFLPGGVTDVLNRLIADELRRLGGQPVVVENRPGVAALLAAQAVKGAPPDGYTLYGGSVTAFTSLYMLNSMDAPRELLPISTFAVGDWFLYVPAEIGVNNLKELAAYAKANPGKFRFSSLSPSNTMLMAVLAKRLGFDFENISYKTTPQVIQALLSGDTQSTFNAASGFESYVQSGKLRAITTLSPKRSPTLPDAPTAVEQGVPLNVQFSNGLWAPLGTPRDVIMKLNGMVAEAVKNPTTAERIRNVGLVPIPSAPEEMIEKFNLEMSFYREAAALIGFKPQ